ncbi:MAG: hydroxymethylglutaryl-CoA lyase [Rhizobiaceae bacterium]|nr:hydroxymethylglutaryl-CoA lyase [Rhizobiaceae bacterium]
MRDVAHLRDVGPRDGLQMVKTILTTDQKTEWFAAAASAGIGEIEVTSFVPPKLLPQFADAEEVARRAVGMRTFKAAALVPNRRGAKRALACGLDTINFVLSASEAHNKANVGRTTDSSLRDFSDVVEARNLKAGTKPTLGGCIATAFGCTIQGAVDEARVVEIAARLAELGADEIVVADTVGYGDPGQVKRLLRSVIGAVAPLPVACHFHDTRGLGLANVTAAVEAGVRAFDASIGGLGGCPFAPGASGNINLEDTAFLLNRLGLETGIDIAGVIALRRKIEGWLPEAEFAGAIARAGMPRTDVEFADAR